MDATDLRRLLAAYADAGNLDRIYNDELSLLENEGYDVELVGSQLLGRDAAQICRQETHRQVAAILSSERLVNQLIRQMHRPEFGEERRTERTAALLRCFCAGFLSA